MSRGLGDVYKRQNQSCLSNAILSLSYDNSTFSPSASASFISGEGLVLTNFHCVARYLEHISDANHDYVKHGCWATQRSEETYLPNLQVNQLITIKDVTTEITQDTGNLTDQALTQKINENGNKIVKSQAKGRGVEGKIYSLFGGRQYILAVFRCFKDVRIVAAPPHLDREIRRRHRQLAMAPLLRRFRYLARLCQR